MSMKTPKELIEWLSGRYADRWCQIPMTDVEEYRDIITYLGAFDQIKWERDIAIGQLEELGYSLGEKIREEDKR